MEIGESRRHQNLRQGRPENQNPTEGSAGIRKVRNARIRREAFYVHGPDTSRDARAKV